MIFVRDKIVETMKAAFPEFGDNIRPYTGRFGELQDPAVSYTAQPALVVAALPMIEAPKEVDPWPLQVNFGIVCMTKAARASDADKLGWMLATQVGRIVYRNCWGFTRQMEITPAVIESIQKQERLDERGIPTGVWYWTVLFHNYTTFDIVLRDPL